MSTIAVPGRILELAIIYHDEEWGVPLRDEHRLFEYIVLDGAQAGKRFRGIPF